jgi:hypothetical protein
MRQASYCTIRFHALPGHLKPEFIEPAKSGQVSTGKARTTGSVGHVEVFLMGSVRTPILGRPRPYPGNDTPTASTPSSAKSPFSAGKG